MTTKIFDYHRENLEKIEEALKNDHPLDVEFLLLQERRQFNSLVDRLIRELGERHQEALSDS